MVISGPEITQGRPTWEDYVYTLGHVSLSRVDSIVRKWSMSRWLSTKLQFIFFWWFNFRCEYGMSYSGSGIRSRTQLAGLPWLMISTLHRSTHYASFLLSFLLFFLYFSLFLRLLFFFFSFFFLFLSGSRGNVLASRSKIKTHWVRWIFSGCQNPEHKSSGRVF